MSMSAKTPVETMTCSSVVQVVLGVTELGSHCREIRGIHGGE